MLKYRDSYSQEIIENQGVLFEKAVLVGYNFEEFITAYMNSKLRYKIDTRQAYYCNLLASELLEEFQKEKKLKQGAVSYDFMIANWVGEFYARVQDILNIPSYIIVKKFPPTLILNKADGLHDYDMSLVIQKIIKQ